MRIAILAAGYGTRLYPLTLKVAKPLVPVNDKPMIDYLIEKIVNLKKKFTIKEVRVVVNNKFFEDFVSWNAKSKIKAKIINDGSNSPEDRLGAVGDMRLAIGGIKEDWLILGGDNLFQDDLVEFVKFSLANRPYPTTGLYDVKSKKEATRFGVVKLNTRNRIAAFEEKPRNPFSTLAASCVYFFPRQSLSVMDRFVKSNENVDASGRYIAWLVKKSKVYGTVLKGKWIDIGHFDSLKRAEKEFD
ncbi:MAG: nucleotidyltransferase family protein [Candidatus Omnitrophota bacterium]